MKIAILLSLLASTGAVDVPNMLCTVVNDPWPTSDTGKSCNQLRQAHEGDCAPGEVREVDIKFTSLSICAAGEGIDEERTELWLRGKAVKNVLEKDGAILPNGPVVVKWADMTDAPVLNESCAKKTFSLKVDKCAEKFSAQLFAYTINNSAGKDFKFDTYMKRNCPLYTDISCTTPSGKDCALMTADTCESGDFEYKFCYSTTFTEHQISIRKNYNDKQNCKTYECQETHAYIGGFVGIGTPVLGYPKQLKIGRNNQNKVCQKEIVNVPDVTCTEASLPKAYMNVVGSVISPSEGAVPASEYKNCFDSTKFNFFDSKPEDANDDCDNTKAPSSKGKGTKAPSSKGTKKPTKCKTKAPTKSKAPSAKGTRLRIRK